MAVKRTNVRMMITFRKSELELIKAEAAKRALTQSKYITHVLRELEVI